MKKGSSISKLIILGITKHLVTVILSVVMLVILFPFDSFAQGGLLLTPRRVVFDGKKNTFNVNLSNSGQDTSTYLISFVQYRMREDGGFDQITEPDSGQFFADKFIRLYPRKVTLSPGTNQVVKLQLRGYKKLKDGEYRSHLIFKLKNNLTALGMDDENKDTTTISIRLVPVFGISIPAIIRKGKSTTKISLSNLSVKMVNDTTPGLNITFNRTGNFSVYGDVTVDYISPDLKEPVQVGLVRGLAVYTPNKLRHFTLPLDNKYNYNKGKLRIVYKSKSDLNKTVTLAEKELILGN